LHESDGVTRRTGKVPAITLGFWITKILATTLGETGGDTVTMSMNWGYLAGTALFLGALIVLVILQIRERQFRPWLYWATIAASTTAGTTMADFADRSLGIGYAGGSLLLLACVAASLVLWYRSCGAITLEMAADPKAEACYWLTITFSQTLGTALGDWMADSRGMGYQKSALLFLLLLSLVAIAYYWTTISRVVLFWAAFVLTRPLGATVGDFLDKPVSHGGLALSRPLATLVIGAAMILCVHLFASKPAERDAFSEVEVKER